MLRAERAPHNVCVHRTRHKLPQNKAEAKMSITAELNAPQVREKKTRRAGGLVPMEGPERGLLRLHARGV